MDFQPENITYKRIRIENADNPQGITFWVIVADIFIDDFYITHCNFGGMIARPKNLTAINELLAEKARDLGIIIDNKTFNQTNAAKTILD